MYPRTQVIQSIFKRNFTSYFSGVLGYLFIVVFVVLGGALAFNARFFTGNEPNLDQLTLWYPLLLLFFIPAITMSVWAEERKAGTDELLFTMPATEIEILMGKYLAVLAVYTRGTPVLHGTHPCADVPWQSRLGADRNDLLRLLDCRGGLAQRRDARIIADIEHDGRIRAGNRDLRGPGVHRPDWRHCLDWETCWSG